MLNRSVKKKKKFKQITEMNNSNTGGKKIKLLISLPSRFENITNLSVSHALYWQRHL